MQDFYLSLSYDSDYYSNNGFGSPSSSNIKFGSTVSLCCSSAQREAVGISLLNNYKS